MKNIPSQAYINTIDHVKSGESFDIQITEIPGILQTVPIPDNLEYYYDSSNYISHSTKPNNFTEHVYFKLRRINLYFKYRLISKQAQSKARILDYGCGTGELVKYLNTRGFNAEGYEPNKKAKQALKENNIASINSLQNIDYQYDIITFFHVLEHLHNPIETLQYLLKYLKPKGSLILALPNYGSWDAKHYKKLWAAYDVPRHLWHFNIHGVHNLAETIECNITTQRGQPLDAYYISLLSERYKKSKLAYIKAFLFGTISNSMALINKQYSSNIYVMRRK